MAALNTACKCLWSFLLTGWYGAVKWCSILLIISRSGKNPWGKLPIFIPESNRVRVRSGWRNDAAVHCSPPALCASTGQWSEAKSISGTVPGHPSSAGGCSHLNIHSSSPSVMHFYTDTTTNTNSITTCWPQSNWKSCGGLEILLRHVTCQQKVDSSGQRQFKELSKQVVDTKHILPKKRD